MGLIIEATSVLSGANVFSDLVITNGIVTSSSTRALAASNIGAAPTSHATTATTYGAANGTNYGHVRLVTANSALSGALYYSQTSSTNGMFYSSGANPSGTTPLKYSGSFYATYFEGIVDGGDWS